VTNFKSLAIAAVISAGIVLAAPVASHAMRSVNKEITIGGVMVNVRKPSGGGRLD
jgi:hypothetical protein